MGYTVHASAKLMMTFRGLIQYKDAVLHWHGNVVILMKFSSLAAPEVVILTTSGAAIDENFIKMTFCLSVPVYEIPLWRYEDFMNIFPC